MKRLLSLLLLIVAIGISRSTAQIASFSFGGPDSSPGWTNVSGDPALAIQTATAGGITLSSVSRSNWSPNANGNCAYISGISGGSYFPSAVMTNNWIQYNGTNNNMALYNVANPQIELTGLNPSSTYILRMSGTNEYFDGATQYTVAGAAIYGSQQLVTLNNITQGVTFQNVQPDANGMIRVYVNCLSSTSFCWISGLQVFSSGSTGVATPVVSLTAPANETVQSEGGNFAISATASETGGSIVKVEFYADTTKIGEADVAPYTMTWVDPDPGSYQLTAKATDAFGTISTASVNVGVQSLNYFWSTTGNAKTGGDTNFVGTVDSNRLAFRTNNIEHMSIGVNGTTRIGRIGYADTLNVWGMININDSANDSIATPNPVNIHVNQNFSPWMNYTNTNSGIGASIGSRYYNDSGLVAQFFSGSYHDYYMPNGFAFHDLSGGGFDFVSFKPNSFVSWGNNFKALGGSEMIFYPGTGHLIIGSTKDSGNNKLQINGNTWTTGFTMPTGASAGYVLTSDTAGNASWKPGGGGHWQFSNGTVYDSTDNVAIGTNNTQGYRLAVNGSAIATKIVVKPQSAWPDYVFMADYSLPSLDSLESYIQREHHLPNIASASEVSKNGIDVGEQQTQLLKKLEEHSLYLIAQNKQLLGENEELNKQRTQLELQQQTLVQLSLQLSRLDKEMNRLKKENTQLKKKLKVSGR